jgi:hypothetical protein
MAAAIGSLYLAWERHDAAQQQMPIPGAIYTSTEHPPGAYYVVGLHTAAHWPVTIFALACALTLLFKASNANRSIVGLVHGAGRLLVFVIALHWFQLAGFVPLPGVVVALCASLLLVYSTIDSFGHAPQAGNIIQ